MPKNTKGGKKFKKGKGPPAMTRQIIHADEDEDQIYGLVEKACGNACFDVKCYDGKTRQCKVRGNMRGKRKVWINVNDTVIISKDVSSTLRDTGHIIHKYNENEVRTLKKAGKLNMPGEVNDNDTMGINFGYNDDDNDSDGDDNNKNRNENTKKSNDDSDSEFDFDAI
jgi:translation initiation factor 1A